MGIYLGMDPQGRLDWLAENAEEVSADEWSWELRKEGQMPLCLTAESYNPVLVCWFKEEMDRAAPHYGDYRPRRYFFAPIDKVLEQLGSNMVRAMREDVAGGYCSDAVELASY